MAATATAANPGWRARPALTLVATGLGLFMIFLDATIVNVALPAIQADLDFGESGLQWVVAAYSLTMGMFMMTSASLADSQGRRRVFAVGLVIFAGASLACGLAPDITVLVLARALQGVGAAVLNVASLALVGAAYPDPKEKMKAVGLWTGIAAIGLALGPTLGGLITDTIGWRWIFLVNPVVAALALIMTYAFVSESKDSTRHSFDPVGQILFIIAIAAITFALVEAPSFGFSSPWIVGPLIAGVVALGVFVWVELRSRDPMMDVRVFGDFPYTAAIITVFAVLFCAYGTLLVITQYFQNINDYSAQTTGLLMLAFTIPSMVLAPIAGRLAARFGGRRPTLAGVALTCAATATLALGVERGLGVTLLGLFLLGLGTGLSVAPATALAMGTISPERSGMASGILSSQRALGSTAGFAIMGSLLALVVAAQLPSALEPIIPDADERNEVVEQIVTDANPQAVPSPIGPGPSGPRAEAQRDDVIEAADAVFTDGIALAEASGFLLALVALFIGWKAFPRSERAEVQEDTTEADLLGP